MPTSTRGLLVSAVAALATAVAGCGVDARDLSSSPQTMKDAASDRRGTGGSVAGGGGAGGSAAGSGGADSGSREAGGDGSTSGGAAGMGGEGGPPPVCGEGDKQCNGATPQTCVGGTWQAGQVCPFVCQGGACAGVCKPGTRQCSGKTPQKCDDAGKWQDDGSPCASVCSDGVCSGTCTPGATQCSSTTQMQTCTNGQWGSSSPCPYACVSGSCGGVCLPNTTQCTSATQVKTCGTNGQWDAAATCPFACVGNSCGGMCVPNSTQCSGNQPQTCGSNGQWATGSACTYVCKNGGCTTDPKNVFITSLAYTAAMGGLFGADNLCQARANSAGLTGTYKAWLADGTGSPATRFTKAGGPYVLAKRGFTVANNWAELASDTHQHAIDSDETGSSLLPLGTGPCASSTNGHQFWSNTYSNGALWNTTASCSNWTDSVTKNTESAWGRTDIQTTGWNLWCHGAGGDLGSCPSSSPLFCVQQ